MVDSVSTSQPICWICRSAASDRFRRSTIREGLSPDHLKITDARYGVTPELHRCRACGFVYAHPLPSEDMVRLYEDLVDPAYQEGQENRGLQMAKILKRGLKGFDRPGSLLDIGAGTGLLVREARLMGWDASGIEPSRWCVETAQQENKVDLWQGTFPHPETSGRRFDVITLIDVIEHVTDPLALLRSVRAQLSERGVLIVSTPDLDSVCARLAGRRWWHYRAAHVCFFNSDSMAEALSSSGFRLREKSRQTWWFPVSYLIHRLGRSLPIGWMDRAMSPGRWLAPLGRVVVPVNPFDSWVFVTEPGQMK